MPTDRLEDYNNEERQEDYADCVVEERLEDYADWVVEERDEDYAPDDGNERRLVIKDLKAALAQGTPCLIGSPAPFKIDRNFPGILAKYYPVLRPSDLTGYEVVKLYNAISFAMWQFGPSAIPNCHIVILWATLGVTDHEHAARLLGEYLNRCQKWAVVGLPETPRRRRRARTGEGFVFRYVYVHENGPQHRFHSHILCTVPPETVPVFKAWTRSILARLARHRGTEKTVRVIPSRELGEEASVRRCWSWFRYFAKQLNPIARWEPVDTRSGELLPTGARQLREVLRVRPHRHAPAYVTCRKLAGCSHDISAGAQRAAGFRSELRVGLPERIYDGQIYDGAELDAWRGRERQRRLEELIPGID